MSVLTLVRHGQAAAFQKDSDVCTQKGELQARKLGAYWVAAGVAFDEVYTGTLHRQQRTERVVAEAYAASGRPWPDPVALPGFNEYDAVGVLSRLVPVLVEKDAWFAELVRAFEQSRVNSAFQRMFEIAMSAWMSGEPAVPGVETWPEFRDRVRGALRHVMTGEGSRRIAVFTSGGPIALAVQTAMQSPERLFLDLNWRVRNCSITEFLFRESRVTLDSFNATPHLDPAQEVTYR